MRTRTKITATDPHKTNFVKLFQVFLWLSLSINYFCLGLNFGLFLLIIYTLPLRLTNFELRSLFLIDFSELLIFIYLVNAGNDLLFRILRQSTIGAERLDCRVRNGIGYNTFAIVTSKPLYNISNDCKY